jgi:hypothetical protein
MIGSEVPFGEGISEGFHSYLIKYIIIMVEIDGK